MAPILLGVILLTGLFQRFISKELIFTVFSGPRARRCSGRDPAGKHPCRQPVNSYVIGETLLDMGVSLYAVTAFVFAWVSVGLVQLPAEMAALGRLYAVSRTLAALVLCIPMALLTVFIVGALP